MARIAAAPVVSGVLAASASGAGAVHIRRSTASDDAMGGTSMGAGNRHLEVQVESRATHAVLTVAPTITLADASAAGGMTMGGKLHVMAMYGIDEGRSDLHYGNNVSRKAGHRYKVVVAVKGERASFAFRAS